MQLHSKWELISGTEIHQRFPKMQQEDLRFNVFCLKIGVFYENVRRTQRRITVSVMLVVAKLNMDFYKLITTATLYDSQRKQPKLH